MADRLDLYLAQERLKPFDWTSACNGDCLLLLLGWWEFAAGRSAGSHWRGSYADEAGARQGLEAFGGAIAAVCDIVGPPRIGSSAVRGDIGLLEIDGWHLGMICTGAMWATRAGTRGIRLLRRDADIAWPVGIR